MFYDAGDPDESHLEAAAAGGILTDIPSAAQAAVRAAGATDRPAQIRPRRSRASAMPGYDHESLEPTQWFAGRALQPEKRLMIAVLADAFDLVLRPPAPPHSRRLPWQRDAARWLRSDDREWPYSFVNICEALSLEPHRVREHLARCIEERRALREAHRQPPLEPVAAHEPAAIDPPSVESTCPPIEVVGLDDETDYPCEPLPEMPPAYPQPWL
jgi:hypothetical protein